MAERCRRVEPLLSAWLDGELDPAERGRIERHLGTCGPCRGVFAELEATRALLRSLPVRRAPANLGARAAARQPAASPSLTRSVRVLAVAVGLLAGVALASAPGEDRGAAREDEPAVPSVPAPLDLYAADHLVHSFGTPVQSPVLLRSGP